MPAGLHHAPTPAGWPPGFVQARLAEALDRGLRVHAVAGLQGTGKSTLAAQLVAAARDRGVRALALSIDDFYLGRRERLRLGRTVHPLCATRGPPGTHDVALACEVLDALAAQAPVRLPRFDKIADRRLPPSCWPVARDIDLVVFEGWCLKVPPQPQAALRLPEGFDPRTHALARAWRNQAGADDAAIVRRALDWIRDDFGYTLDTPLPGRHAVDEFLFDTQAGYCEHFSSAFVVLMRAAGIPARVVTGYVGGYRNPIGDYWLVRRSDAHAWAEVWLDGPGWTRVDPTAAVAPEHIYDTLADRSPGAGFGELAPAVDMADWLRRGWNDFVLGFDAARQRALFQPLGLEATPWRLAGVFATIAGLALALTAWLVARRERERDIVLRAWRMVGRRYAHLGLGRRPDEPALAWAARVAAARPDGAPGLVALSGRFARWRYARRQGDVPVDASAARALADDLRAHRP